VTELKPVPPVLPVKEPSSLISLGSLLSKKFTYENEIIGSGLLTYGSELVIAGPAKLGKSFIAAELMISLATGQPLFGACRVDKHGVNQYTFAIRSTKKILYIEKEIGEATWQDRFRVLMSSLPEQDQLLCAKSIQMVSMDYHTRFDTMQGIERIRDYYLEAGSPEVVVFDPFNKFFLGSENDDRDMRTVIYNLSQLRKTMGFTCVLVHHVGKDAEREGLNMLRGHSSLEGDLDSALLFRHGKGGLFRCDVVMRRGAPVDSFYIRRNNETMRSSFHCWYHDPQAKSKVRDYSSAFDD